MDFDGKIVRIGWLTFMVSLIIVTAVFTVGIITWVDSKIQVKADVVLVKEFIEKNDEAHKSLTSSMHSIDISVTAIKAVLEDRNARDKK